MAGFGKLLAALDREHGTTSLSSYVQTVSDSELDVVAGDPLADAVLRFTRVRGQWRGSAVELLEEITSRRDFTPEERRNWRIAQELSASLTRLSKVLRRAGLQIERGKTNGKRWIELRMDIDQQ